MGWEIAIPSSKDIQALVESVKALVSVEQQRLMLEQEISGTGLLTYFSITSNGVTAKGVQMAELREGQQLELSVTLKTQSGNPASYQKGTAKFVSSDPAVASVDPDPSDELKATLKGLDGSSNTPVLVTFTCDGDPDDNESRDVVATLDVVVTQGEAVVAEIEAGEPTDTRTRRR